MVTPFALLRTMIAGLFAALLVLAPARAADIAPSAITLTTTISWTVEDDGGDDSAATLLADDSLANAGAAVEGGTTRRYVPTAGLAPAIRGKTQFGPFAVIDGMTAEMAGDVDSATPRAFAAMLAAYPTLKRLEMVDCPGSLDEAANLVLARAIRRAGLATNVPPGGSVRSGAVELFLAGVTRSAAPDAEFGVHSWRDENGYEASDYPADDPVHAEYLNYYREMGLDAAKARAFYALTNSTSFDDVRYLTRDDMARFVVLTGS